MSFHDLDDASLPAPASASGGEIGNVCVAIERLNMFSESQYRRLSGVFSRHATFKMRQLRLFAAFRDRTRTAAPP
jgi:hypothetical protein